MSIVARRLAVLALPLLLGGTACLPYTVGTTAQTAPAGRTTATWSSYYIPNALKSPDDSIGVPMFGVDREWRHGLSERSDVGIRLTSGGGAVVNYKRRFQDAGAGTPAVAYMVGGGIVNGGAHLHLESTLIASGDETATMMPFGGLRAMQVVPITAGAPSDSPTLGVFGGMQFGDATFSLRPEIGIFYDRSTLGVRSSSVIVVPAITLQRGRRARSDSRPVRVPVMPGAGRGVAAP